MSNNKDEELIQLIQDVIAGNAEKKELCNKIYKEVYALAYPVYQDGEKSMTQAKKALIEVCKSVELIDLERNVHKQIATIVSVYFFTSAVSEHEEELKDSITNANYEYSRIREDEELLAYMRKKAEAFRSPKAFDEQDEAFRSLSDIQMSLMELYAYEMQSIESIEDMTDIDSLYIGQWIEQARSILLGYELSAEVEQDSENEEVYIADEQEEQEQEENIINYDEQYEPSDDYKERKAVSSVYEKASNMNFRENSVTRFLERIFPTLNLKARTFISWGMGCFVIVVMVSVLFVSVKAARNNKKTVKDYDYQDMQYYTQPTTKQQSTSTEATQTSSATEATTNNETTANDSTTRQANNNTTEETTTERSYNRNNWTNTNEAEPENSSEENREPESSSEENREPESSSEENREPESSSEENREPESSSEENREPESSSEANTEPESSSSSNDSGNDTDDANPINNSDDTTN